MSGDEIVRAFMREFPKLELTREQQEWLAAEIDKDFEEAAGYDPFKN